MPQFRNEKSEYRQRGFECGQCHFMTMVFGLDSNPDTCLNCNATGTLSKKWDHHVVTATTVKDWIDPTS